MTAMKAIIVYCDTCGSEKSDLAFASNADQVRVDLRQRGWKVDVPHTSGDHRRLDFCSKHKKGK